MPATLELFARRAPSQAPWRWIFPVTFVMAHSTIYELLEWAAAVTFGGNLGQIYLGTQGDAWDAQKDMLMASVGSLAAIILLSVLRWGPLSPRPAGSR
jgi:putative membrane protein